MKYGIECKFTFEAGHVLKKAYMSACSENLHGHSYKLYVKLETDKLNEDGMVVDFKKVKEAIKPCVDMLDHSFIVAKDDTRLASIKKSSKKVLVMKEKFFEKFDFNPTAEAIAFWLYHTIAIHLPIELGVVNKDFKLKVTLFETENNSVTIEE